jgi:hypothetical protein
MLVSQPRTSTDIIGPLGRGVWVSVGVSDGIRVEVAVAVMNTMLVAVGAGASIVDVALGTRTMGVAVKIEGVPVGGKNGVGRLLGRNTQPLQEVMPNIKRINRIVSVVFFMISPRCHCIPLGRSSKAPVGGSYS